MEILVFTLPAASNLNRYNNVIMSSMSYQITGVYIFCPIVGPGADLCAGNSPVTGGFPAQKAINAENVVILWRHHAVSQSWLRSGRRGPKRHVAVWWRVRPRRGGVQCRSVLTLHVWTWSHTVRYHHRCTMYISTHPTRLDMEPYGEISSQVYNVYQYSPYTFGHGAIRWDIITGEQSRSVLTLHVRTWSHTVRYHHRWVYNVDQYSPYTFGHGAIRSDITTAVQYRPVLTLHIQTWSHTVIYHQRCTM